MTKLTIEAMFNRYIYCLSKDFPYLRLVFDDSKTVISLGYEHCDDLEKRISHQDFFDFIQVPMTINFRELKAFFESNAPKIFNPKINEGGISKDEPRFIKVGAIVSLSGNEVLVENKHTIEEFWGTQDENIKFKYTNKGLLEYLSSHKRTILNVSKERRCVCGSYSYDPCPIGFFDATIATPLLECDYYYTPIGDRGFRSAKTAGDFVTSLFELVHLDKAKFSICCLKDGINGLTLEIINNEIIHFKMLL